jgi:hypothetical protein
MARQKSFIKLEGKIGDVSFYKTEDGYFAKESKGVSKERIVTDPRFERTRENFAEFGSASHLVGLLRGAIWPAFKLCEHKGLHGRLVKKANQILKSDTESDRGERRMAKGDWSTIHGFDINEKAKFTNVVKSRFKLTEIAGGWEVFFPHLDIPKEVKAPKAATHVRFYLIGGAFGPREILLPYHFEMVNTDPIPVESQPIELTLTAPCPLGDYDYYAVTLGMEFLLVSGNHVMEVGRLKLNPSMILKAGMLIRETDNTKEGPAAQAE